MRTVEIAESDRSGEVDVSVNSFISIRLPENPTTGYRWHLERIPSCLKEEADEFQQAEIPGVGVGGVRHITLWKASPGKGEVVLKLYREWEGKDSSLREFSIRINDSH